MWLDDPKLVRSVDLKPQDYSKMYRRQREIDEITS